MGISVEFSGLDDVTVYGNSGIALGAEEYAVDGDRVSHVDGKFKNAISRIDLIA